MHRKKKFNIYWGLQSVIVPKLKYSQSIYEKILEVNSNKAYVWLDLGCGHNLLQSWRFEEEKKLIKKTSLIIGIDYDFLSLVKHKSIINRVRGDISELPFQDNLFDLVTSNMVFEHLKNPEKQLKEIARILKPGGKLIFHTPNNFGYTTIMARVIPERIKAKIIYILQGRKEEDVFPAFYRINTSKNIKTFAKLAGLKVKSIKMICSAAQFVIFPLIVSVELIYIKLLMTKVMKPLRTNIIAVLEKT